MAIVVVDRSVGSDSGDLMVVYELCKLVQLRATMSAMHCKSSIHHIDPMPYLMFESCDAMQYRALCR